MFWGWLRFLHVDYAKSNFVNGPGFSRTWQDKPQPKQQRKQEFATSGWTSSSTERFSGNEQKEKVLAMEIATEADDIKHVKASFHSCSQRPLLKNYDFWSLFYVIGIVQACDNFCPCQPSSCRFLCLDRLTFCPPSLSPYPSSPPPFSFSRLIARINRLDQRRGQRARNKLIEWLGVHRYQPRPLHLRRPPSQLRTGQADQFVRDWQRDATGESRICGKQDEPFGRVSSRLTGMAWAPPWGERPASQCLLCFFSGIYFFNSLLRLRKLFPRKISQWRLFHVYWNSLIHTFYFVPYNYRRQFVLFLLFAPQ